MFTLPGGEVGANEMSGGVSEIVTPPRLASCLARCADAIDRVRAAILGTKVLSEGKYAWYVNSLACQNGGRSTIYVKMVVLLVSRGCVARHRELSLWAPGW
jgi:hypothetical protein